jgi:hypothetical protein
MIIGKNNQVVSRLNVPVNNVIHNSKNLSLRRKINPKLKIKRLNKSIVSTTVCPIREERVNPIYTSSSKTPASAVSNEKKYLK